MVTASFWNWKTGNSTLEDNAKQIRLLRDETLAELFCLARCIFHSLRQHLSWWPGMSGAMFHSCAPDKVQTRWSVTPLPMLPTFLPVKAGWVNSCQLNIYIDQNTEKHTQVPPLRFIPNSCFILASFFLPFLHCKNIVYIYTRNYFV